MLQKPNTAETVTFTAIPLKAGEFPITVSAFVTEGNQPQADIVEKTLYVVVGNKVSKLTHTDFIIEPDTVYVFTAVQLFTRSG